jgi:hypothetical protein
VCVCVFVCARVCVCVYVQASKRLYSEEQIVTVSFQTSRFSDSEGSSGALALCSPTEGQRHGVLMLCKGFSSGLSLMGSGCKQLIWLL